ncbi:MAG: hypothetical protein J7647_21025 [Cyanobacteria bacterium SBLK]|nr:hypothetical protein [Cyanobacteria bacterium SBLK]
MDVPLIKPTTIINYNKKQFLLSAIGGDRTNSGNAIASSELAKELTIIW